MTTRRHFLAFMAGAAAGAQELTPVEPLARRGPEQRVIVLGAGLAGLCTAYLSVLAAREGRIHLAGEHTSPWTGWMQVPWNPHAESCAKSIPDPCYLSLFTPLNAAAL